MTDCGYCDKPIRGTGVVDGAYTFCSQDCQDAASERYWMNVWAAR